MGSVKALPANIGYCTRNNARRCIEMSCCTCVQNYSEGRENSVELVSFFDVNVLDPYILIIYQSKDLFLSIRIE